MKRQTTRGGGNNPAETISRLQRGVLKLASSFQGQSAELDNRMKELSTLMRGGQKDGRLQNVIDEIVDTIVSQKITQNFEQRGGNSLSALLERIQSELPGSDDLSTIRQELSLPLAPEQFALALDNTASTIARIVLDNGSTAKETSESSSGGHDAITRLLDGIDHPIASSVELAEIRQLIRALNDRVELNREIDKAAQILSTELGKSGNSQNLSGARDQLLLLMNLIPLPASLTDRSSRTRRSIEQAETAATLYGCIPEIADLTAMMRTQFQSEIDELGEFLKKTLGRLRKLEAQIQQSHTFHHESVEHAFNLERSMGEHADGMRADVNGESDIESIKAAVSSHLDKIDESLSEFVQVEDERHNQARERITHMVSALNELEFEAKELRDSREKQHAQVLVDPLTGVLNRSGYDENINKEFVRWRRYGSNLSVSVIDLDLNLFKDINDNYGHSAGDKVLATIARQIQGQIRECDILCRYGGEEFILLLPETSVVDATDFLFGASLRLTSTGLTRRPFPERFFGQARLVSPSTTRFENTPRASPNQSAFFGGTKLIKVSSLLGPSYNGPSTNAPLGLTTILANALSGAAA